MDPDFEALAKQRASNLGLTFSAYINQLIRADLQERKPLSLHEENAPLRKKQRTNHSPRA
jgi:hypothetical protein